MLTVRKHLAIFTKSAALEVLEGRKTIETRFSLKKIAPFGRVSVGDIVYIKISGGDIIGQFWIAKVIYFEGLDQKDWELIKNNFGDRLSLGSDLENQKFFTQKSASKFGTLIFIDKVEQLITSPIKFIKHDQRGWVVLD